MKFTTYSDRGGMKINEDYTGSANKNGIYCFVVADGFGTNGSGAVAAELTVKTVLDEFMKNPRLDTFSICSYIESAQKVLLEKKSSEAKYGEMGCAAAVLMTDGTKAVWANVGDVRIYMYSGFLIKKVSEDHSVAFDKFKNGEIKYSQIRNDLDTNKLRRALGDRIAWQPSVSGTVRIGPHNSFLICTDGFWKNITEPETELIKLFSRSSKHWLKRMLKKAIKRLNAGSDNLSAVTIKMQLTDIL